MFAGNVRVPAASPAAVPAPGASPAVAGALALVSPACLGHRSWLWPVAAGSRRGRSVLDCRFATVRAEVAAARGMSGAKEARAQGAQVCAGANMPLWSSLLEVFRIFPRCLVLLKRWNRSPKMVDFGSRLSPQTQQRAIYGEASTRELQAGGPRNDLVEGRQCVRAVPR